MLTVTDLLMKNKEMEKINEAVCRCGKVCKNQRGLKIHQAKKGCVTPKELQQRTEKSGETSEVQEQETNHSIQDHHVAVENEISEQIVTEPIQRDKPKNIERKERIKWPKSNEERKWQDLDDDLDCILNETLKGNIESKLESFVTIIYSVSRERFGVIETKGKNEQKQNRRQLQKSNIRKELKQLKQRFKTSSLMEKEGIIELRDILRKKLKNISQAERNRNKRKKKQKAREEFSKNPFEFTSKLLGKARSGRLECPKEEVEEYLAKTHDDEHRLMPLDENPDLYKPEDPIMTFDESDIKLKEVKDIVNKARAKSSPGPSGINYQLYKKCPKILKRLWNLMKVVWRKGVTPRIWTTAEGVFVPKEESSKKLNQFRTISLLSVEGKIFFSILAKRLTSYLIENNYINTAVQKGGVPGYSGCLEHTAMITHLIQEAKETKSDLALIWLDLANAYGSVPHELVKLSLRMYKVPPKFT